MKKECNRPTRVRYLFLVFASLLSFLLYLDRTCIAEAAGSMREEFGIDQAQMSWVFAAFSFGYLLFEAPSGAWGDRFGPKRVLCRIVLCWSLFTALTGCVQAFTLDTGFRLRLPLIGLEVPVLLTGFMTLLVIRFLFGAGEAGAYPNLAKSSATWFALSDRGFAQATIITAGRVGAGVASGAMIVVTSWAGTLLSSEAGWRAPFWLFGALGAVWVIFFAAWFRDSPAGHPSVNAAELAWITGCRPASATSVPVDQADRGRHIPWRMMLTSGNLWALSGAAFFSTTAYYLFLTWFPTYLRERHHLSRGWGWVAGLPMIAGAAGCLLGGLLTDWLLRRSGSRRWSRRLIGVGAKGGAAALLLAGALADDPRRAVGLIVLAAFVDDLAMAPLWAVCTDTGGRFAATVFALMNTVAAAAAIMSPLAAGYLLEHLAPSGSLDVVARHRAWDAILFFYAAMLAASAACWAAIDADRPIAV